MEIGLKHVCRNSRSSSLSSAFAKFIMSPPHTWKLEDSDAKRTPWRGVEPRFRASARAAFLRCNLTGACTSRYTTRDGRRRKLRRYVGVVNFARDKPSSTVYLQPITPKNTHIIASASPPTPERRHTSLPLIQHLLLGI